MQDEKQHQNNQVGHYYLLNTLNRNEYQLVTNKKNLIFTMIFRCDIRLFAKCVTIIRFI